MTDRYHSTVYCTRKVRSTINSRTSAECSSSVMSDVLLIIEFRRILFVFSSGKMWQLQNVSTIRNSQIHRSVCIEHLNTFRTNFWNEKWVGKMWWWLYNASRKIRPKRCKITTYSVMYNIWLTELEKCGDDYTMQVGRLDAWTSLSGLKEGTYA